MAYSTTSGSYTVPYTSGTGGNISITGGSAGSILFGGDEIEKSPTISFEPKLECDYCPNEDVAGIKLYINKAYRCICNTCLMKLFDSVLGFKKANRVIRKI